MAPPTSLVVAGSMPEPPAPRRPTARPVLLVLGADSDLGMLERLAGQVAPMPASALGAARHVRAQLASTIARPDAVLHAWRANREAVGAYYGTFVTTTRRRRCRRPCR